MNEHFTDTGSDSVTLDMVCYTEDERGSFWTGPHFGCVHHHQYLQRPKARVATVPSLPTHREFAAQG